jgi:hypothetical protein
MPFWHEDCVSNGHIDAEMCVACRLVLHRVLHVQLQFLEGTLKRTYARRRGHGGSVVVEALRYKPEGSRHDKAIELYQFTGSFRLHWALEFTQPLSHGYQRQK